MIMDAAQQTGFITIDEHGKRIAGEGGCTGFLRWLYLNEPKTAAALLARVLPYFITVTEAPPVASRSEIEAEFKELGLPLTLRCQALDLPEYIAQAGPYPCLS
jgi:hypothetical protein